MSAFETKEIPKEIPVLKNLLISSVFSPTISIPNGIKEINLGTIGVEAEGILDRTLKDPKGLERSRTIIVNQNGGVVISTRDDVGVKTDSGQEISPSPISYKEYIHSKSLPYNKRYDRYLGGFVHSHGLHDLPMSPADFRKLFGNSSDGPFEISPMVMVITPELKQIYFRGNKTPQWGEEYLDNKVKHWKDLLGKNIRNSLKPGMSVKEIVGINATIIHKYIRSMKEKYDLKLYSCPIDRNVVVEESA